MVFFEPRITRISQIQKIYVIREIRGSCADWRQAKSSKR